MGRGQWLLGRSLREVRWGPVGIGGKCILGEGMANEKPRGRRRWACSVSQPEGPGPECTEGHWGRGHGGVEGVREGKAEVMGKLVRDPGLGELGRRPQAQPCLARLSRWTRTGSGHSGLGPRAIEQQEAIWSSPVCLHKPTLQIGKLRLGGK